MAQPRFRWDPRSKAPSSELRASPGDSRPRFHIPTSAETYQAALEGLTALDEDLLRRFDFPPIYEADVQYRKEAEDVWRHALDVYRSHWGDCEDLAGWRAAELRVSGEDPGAFVYIYRSGPTTYHAVVGRSDGSVEDPSYILGMRVPRGWKPISRVGETRRHPWNKV